MSSSIPIDGNGSSEPTTDGFRIPDDRIAEALNVLLQALHYSVDSGRQLWDFAVESATLGSLGLTRSEFRWLICRGYVAHADEITLPGQAGRTFRPLGELCLTESTCFVLTPEGRKFAERLASGRQAAGDRATAAEESVAATVPGPSPVPSNSKALPHWDSMRHEFSVSGQVVKRFKHPSPNQETILSAFQEEHWPPQIADPLPPSPHIDPKRRLSETIKSLNRRQKVPLIRFMGDGTGEGVLWELSEQLAQDSSSPTRPRRSCSS